MEKVICAVCGNESQHESFKIYEDIPDVLYTDLIQMQDWYRRKQLLQCCPFCAYVAPFIDEAGKDIPKLVKSKEYMALSADKKDMLLSDQFICRAFLMSHTAHNAEAANALVYAHWAYETVDSLLGEDFDPKQGTKLLTLAIHALKNLLTEISGTDENINIYKLQLADMQRRAGNMKQAAEALPSEEHIQNEPELLAVYHMQLDQIKAGNKDRQSIISEEEQDEEEQLSDYLEEQGPDINRASIRRAREFFAGFNLVLNDSLKHILIQIVSEIGNATGNVSLVEKNLHEILDQIDQASSFDDELKQKLNTFLDACEIYIRD